MPNSNCIRTLLNIPDKNIIFDNNSVSKTVTNGITYTTVDAVLTYKPKCCPKCGCVNENYSITKHSFTKCSVKYNKIINSPCIINLKKQRFSCKECKATFMAETSLVNKHCQISNSLHAE
ncbi:transposase family protein, partial [Granulicatella balaenopterae]